MSVNDQIIEACKAPSGMSLRDVSEKLDKHITTMSTMICQLVKHGRLFRAGKPRFMRYFATEAAAKEWEPIGLIEYRSMQAEAKQRNKETRNAKRRKNTPPGRPVSVKTPKPPKPSKAAKVKAYKPVPIVLRSACGPKVAEKKAAIVWPEHVRIQVIPTPPPRFAFQPPSGWRGQISTDWMNQRLGAMK